MITKSSIFKAEDYKGLNSSANSLLIKAMVNWLVAGDNSDPFSTLQNVLKYRSYSLGAIYAF